MKEKTLLLIKPDAVRRGLVGDILARFERKQMRIEAIRTLSLEDQLIEQLYSEHLNNDYFPPFKDFMKSGPVIAAVIAGEGAIKAVRRINGATNPQEAAPGTIRGDYGTITRYNLVHGSDGPKNAEREIEVLFPEYNRRNKAE